MSQLFPSPFNHVAPLPARTDHFLAIFALPLDFLTLSSPNFNLVLFLKDAEFLSVVFLKSFKNEA